MGLLKKKYEEAIKKSKGGLGTKYSGFTPYFKTGIDIFDYINGSRREDGSLALGIQGGKIIMDIGASGSGKTSKIIEMACGIADQYEESDVWHYDYERSTSKERVMNLTGWSSEHYEEKYQLFQKDISAETLFRACKEIEKIKKENYDDIKIDSGYTDSEGNPIYYLPPTILIVDSVALLAPEDVEDDDDLKGSMGAAAIAKSNTNIFKRIMTPIESANIIVMLVNHLTTKIEIGVVKTQAQVNYLSQQDSVPGKQNNNILAA
jgi:RecA/RadA recombinase